MPPKGSSASDGGSADRRSPAALPREELAEIREIQQRQAASLRERIMETMLLACGEVGFRGITVEMMVDRYGGYRAQFYRHFANLAECYAAAYAWRAEGLCDEILAAGAAAPDWRQGMERALGVIADFVSAQPLVARALLIDVHVAGEPALAKRKELFERLSNAIDSARRENESRHSPPPLTALFMLSAIEAAAVSALMAGAPSSFTEAAPDLGQMIVGAYFGDDG